MLSYKTIDAIEIIKSMDLKVAIPEKLKQHTRYYGVTETVFTVEHIHVPSIFTAYEIEIRDLMNQVKDLKMATAILLDIKKEFSQTPE